MDNQNVKNCVVKRKSKNSQFLSEYLNSFKPQKNKFSAEQLKQKGFLDN